MRIGFCGLLTLIFIACKLTGHIAWPWLWVISPLIIGFVLLAMLALFVIVCAVIANH